MLPFALEVSPVNRARCTLRSDSVGAAHFTSASKAGNHVAVTGTRLLSKIPDVAGGSLSDDYALFTTAAAL
jgi:hypothetical protein